MGQQITGEDTGFQQPAAESFDSSLCALIKPTLSQIVFESLGRQPARPLAKVASGGELSRI
ncbi:hypothetical protein, partial [Marinobacter confluentis]|uniref:hypothetical protein n=1 Tax=Marinobacter confluentis TaxID=1697557 RepID=UPI001B2FFF8A